MLAKGRVAQSGAGLSAAARAPRSRPEGASSSIVHMPVVGSRSPRGGSPRGEARGYVALLGAALALSAVHPAEAEPPGPGTPAVAVLTVRSDDALDQAEALTVALRAAVRAAAGVSLAPDQPSLEFLALKLRCAEPIDAPCEARMARSLGVDRLLYGDVRLSGPRVVGILSMFVRGKGSRRADLAYASSLVDGSDEALQAVARQALAKLRGSLATAAVGVETGGASGEAHLGGEGVGVGGASGGEHGAQGGPHPIVPEAVGGGDAATEVVAPDDGKLALAPTLAPASAAPAPAAPAAVERPRGCACTTVSDRASASGLSAAVLLALGAWLRRPRSRRVMRPVAKLSRRRLGRRLAR